MNHRSRAFSAPVSRPLGLSAGSPRLTRRKELLSTRGPRADSGRASMDRQPSIESKGSAGDVVEKRPRGKADVRDNLTTMVAVRRGLTGLPRMEQYRELWWIDLSMNRISHLDGLERFSALGMLWLGGNRITWDELFKIRHIQIMDLVLCGNPIEKDPHYRKHVIAILQKVWSIDGMLVTSVERASVERYFNQVERDPKLRKKRPRSTYIPTAIRNVHLTGIHGSRTVAMIQRFPMQLPPNTILDRRRIEFMAASLEDHTGARLRGLIVWPPDRRNMLLLLLASSLVYALPSDLVRATLVMAELATFGPGKIPTMDLFMLSPVVRNRLVALLISSSEVDLAEGLSTKIYPKLGRCFAAVMAWITRQIQAEGYSPANDPSAAAGNAQPQPYVNQIKRSRQPSTVPLPRGSATAATAEDFGNLLAVELSQLLCLVPDFVSHVGEDGDGGLIEILSASTGDEHVYYKLLAELSAGGDANDSEWGPYSKATTFLLSRIRKDAAASDADGSTSLKSIFTAEALPNQTTNGTIIDPSKFRGGTANEDTLSTCRRKQRSQSARARLSPDNWRREPEIGTECRTEQGNLARVIGIPEAGVLYMQYVSANSEPQFHYIARGKMQVDQRGRWLAPEPSGQSQFQLRQLHKARPMTAGPAGPAEVSVSTGPRLYTSEEATVVQPRPLSSRPTKSPALVSNNPVRPKTAPPRKGSATVVIRTGGDCRDDDIDSSDEEILWDRRSPDGRASSVPQSPVAVSISVTIGAPSSADNMVACDKSLSNDQPRETEAGLDASTAPATSREAGIVTLKSETVTPMNDADSQHVCDAGATGDTEVGVATSSALISPSKHTIEPDEDEPALEATNEECSEPDDVLIDVVLAVATEATSVKHENVTKHDVLRALSPSLSESPKPLLSPTGVAERPTLAVHNSFGRSGGLHEGSAGADVNSDTQLRQRARSRQIATSARSSGVPLPQLIIQGRPPSGTR